MRTILFLIQAIVLLCSLGSCDIGLGSVGSNTPPPFLPPSIYDWTFQNSGTEVDLYGVFFIDNNYGWVVGESQTVLVTSNSGQTWPQAPSTAKDSDLRSVFIVDSQTGWITGESEENTTNGYVFKSSMGGAYPTLQYAAEGSLNTVAFLNQDVGWAAGAGSTLLHTSNGGFNWTMGTIGSDLIIFDLHFFDEELGWSVTDAGIYRTKDGASWQAEDETTAWSLRAIHFVDTLHGWACGDNNTIMRREINGNNEVIWTRSSIEDEPGSMVWNDIFFIDTQSGWVVGNTGRIHKTVDGGRSWSLELTGLLTNINSIYMVSSTNGWIVGDDGAILTYTP